MKKAQMEVTYIDHMGGDINVVNAARVSFGKEVQQMTDSDVKLIKYLATHGHWSPLAHTSLSIRVKAPLFIAGQFKKHQIGLTWNEVSRRYVSTEPEFYLPEVWRGRPEGSIKQGSAGEVAGYKLFCEYYDTDAEYYAELTPERVVELCLDLYKNMLEAGVAPEQARMILPQCTMTEWIWTGSAVAFDRIIKQRIGHGAQQEASELAEMIKAVVVPCYPSTFEALFSLH
jgi:thymidylate synthase (FAD)